MDPPSQLLLDNIPNCKLLGWLFHSPRADQKKNAERFGMHNVNTHDATYLVFGNFFKNLPDTHLDVAFGLVGLAFLYAIRYGTAHLGRRYPRYDKLWFLINIMRNGMLVIFGTLIAFLIQIGKSQSPISILKTVPAGFQALGVPSVDVGLLSKIAGTLPSVVIILILEHVAIAKSFGRRNNYKINPDQEIIAIGVANIIGVFFGMCISYNTYQLLPVSLIKRIGAYPNTGSFSRTAIMARSGVRTPLAGVFSALVVLLCLYALTPAFYYIPDAILAAVIIHAVSDLVSGPKFVQHLWQINPLELFTFVAAIIITFFTTVEYGIYVSVGLSIFFMLIRIARPRYAVLGRVPVRPIKQEGPANADEKDSGEVQYVYVRENHPTLHEMVEPPPAGVVIFRIDESLTYPNAGFVSDKIMHYIQDNFVAGRLPPTKKGDRAWNDSRPLVKPEEIEAVQASLEANGRKLKAIVMDFSGVNHLDSTGVQALLDLRLAINRYVDREVEWHFSSLASPFIRNALIIGGFGKQNGRESLPLELLPVVPPNKDAVQQEDRRSQSHYDYYHQDDEFEIDIPEKRASLSIRSSPTIHDDDLESARSVNSTNSANVNTPSSPSLKDYYHLLERGVPIDRYPFFHWDLEDAVRAATIACSKD